MFIHEDMYLLKVKCLRKSWVMNKTVQIFAVSPKILTQEKNLADFRRVPVAVFQDELEARKTLTTYRNNLNILQNVFFLVVVRKYLKTF